MKISALPTTVSPSLNHEFPARLATNTHRLTIQQALDLIRANISNGAPANLDTLDELAAAINDDPNFYNTMNTALAGRQPLDGMLTALAALTSAANKFLAFTGVDAPAVRDINGTVAGTVAAPTGALFEYGSNANGEYLKLANGVLICWYTATVTNQAINTSYTGGLYSGSRNWTFPAAFASGTTPSVHGKIRWGVGLSWAICHTTDNAVATISAIDATARASGTNTDLAFIAIGKAF